MRSQSLMDGGLLGSEKCLVAKMGWLQKTGCDRLPAIFKGPEK